MQSLWVFCKTIFCKGVLLTQYADGAPLGQLLLLNEMRL
jgi:hypothetical protein